MGRFPQLIPPLIPSLPVTSTDNLIETSTIIELIEHLALNVKEAQDNLLRAKINQAESVNRQRGIKVPYKKGDNILLLTEHRRYEYMQAGSRRAAKFMPRFDGLYLVTDVHLEKSNYTLDLLNELNRHPSFHSSQLQKFIENNSKLFPSQALSRPGLIVTAEGEEEWVIEWIIDKYRCGWGHQYLVRWKD